MYEVLRIWNFPLSSKYLEELWIEARKTGMSRQFKIKINANKDVHVVFICLKRSN